jgi:hypothetical protein
MMGGMLTAEAADYPYLTFEKTDGTKTSVSTESLTISISSSVLTAGSASFNLADLSKMYFSESDVTATESVQDNALDAASVKYYDLQGWQDFRDQMTHEVYIMVHGSKVIKVQK